MQLHHETTDSDGNRYQLRISDREPRTTTAPVIFSIYGGQFHFQGYLTPTEAENLGHALISTAEDAWTQIEEHSTAEQQTRTPFDPNQYGTLS